MNQAPGEGVASLAFVAFVALGVWMAWNEGPTYFWSLMAAVAVAVVIIVAFLAWGFRKGQAPMQKLRRRKGVIVHPATMLPLPLDGSQDKIGILKNEAALVISREALELHDLRKKDADAPIVLRQADVVGIRLEPVSFLRRPESALFIDTRAGTIALVLMLPKVDMQGRPVAPGTADVAQLLYRWHAGMTGSTDFSGGQ